jgi:membrane-bound lytic murein transglycosylase D
MINCFRSFCSGVAFATISVACVASAASGSPAANGVPGPSSPATTESAAADFVLDTHESDGYSGPHSPDTDDRLARSEAHFNSGRQFYFRGDLPAAKREFDTAVDMLLNAPENAPDRVRIERRLDELCDLIYRFDVEKLGSGKKDEEAVVFDKAPIDEISHMTFPVDENLAPKLKFELNQTTSAIPLELADPVLSYVRFFQSERGRNILIAGLRRSGKYRSLIQKIFTEEGVPQELIYLAQAESGFLPRAVSFKNAVGMWQFIAGTGTIYQLERNASYDERLDPEKATRAAAKYLKDLYARYNDWYLAMAAYNCGAGAVDRAVERTGYADYWELLKRHALPKETSGYVPIILAMTIAAKNPQDYGLENVEVDPAVEYDTIQVSAPTNLQLVADATLQPLSVIRELNPALLKSVAPAGFSLHVPKGAGETTETALNVIPAPNRAAWRLHHVLAGDTLATIAKSYHVTPERIADVNHASDSLEAGDVLLIPAAYHEESNGFKLRSASSRRRVSTSRRGTRIAASRRVPAPVLHRKAAVRTASLQY